jgi:cephalosporin hydroxylase
LGLEEDNMNPIRQFEAERKHRIEHLAEDQELLAMSLDWMVKSSRHRYTYNFSWLGRPIIQFPQDIVAMQEIIWEVKPDVIIETGIAHGGSLIFYASMLELQGNAGLVVGVDIDIRQHNREAIESHPMSPRIRLIQGPSTEHTVVEQVRGLVAEQERVMVILDSNHTHDHVLRELKLYSPLVTRGSYLIVFDTSVEDAPDELFAGRPWGKGNNPKTAVREFLATDNRFEVDRTIDAKLLITVAPEGYLRCVRD